MSTTDQSTGAESSRGSKTVRESIIYKTIVSSDSGQLTKMNQIVFAPRGAPHYSAFFAQDLGISLLYQTQQSSHPAFPFFLLDQVDADGQAGRIDETKRCRLIPPFGDSDRPR